MAHVVISVGTYEGFFNGFHAIKSEEGGYELRHIYASPAHTGCIHSLAISSKYAATGGKDETIQLYNIMSKLQIGSLSEHEGSITCLEFWGNSHLFSGSEDGNLCIWKAGGNWQLLRTLKGHKRGITSLAIHPSGKLAITVSKDKTIRTWNLITGLKAYITNLPTAGDLVLWSNDGTHYVIVCGSIVNVYAIEKANIINTIDYGQKVHAVIYLDDNHLAIGGEGGIVQIHKADSKSIKLSFTAHENGRIKGLAKVEALNSRKKSWLVTASSDGSIKLWKINRKIEGEPQLLAETNINQRITCLSAGKIAEPDETSLSSPIVTDVEEPVEVKIEDDVCPEEIPRKKRKSVTISTPECPTTTPKRKKSKDKRNGVC